MSSFSRRRILAAFMLGAVLTACGFRPVYKQGTAASGLQGKIAIKPGKGREYFEMRERLVERFGFAENPRYVLSFTFVATSEGLAVSKTAEITRYNFDGVSNFKITDAASDVVLLKGTVKSTTAYSATAKTYPTRVAEQDARSRLAKTLADQIVTRISSTANSWAK
ncbi:MAG: LPS assembly lipoprotein LptE [Rhodobacterales bacterium]